MKYKFPSPTGVNYYELSTLSVKKRMAKGFRPQQGLTIMNALESIKRITQS